MDAAGVMLAAGGDSDGERGTMPDEKREAWLALAARVQTLARDLGTLSAAYRLHVESERWPDPGCPWRVFWITAGTAGQVWLDQEEERRGRGRPRERTWDLLEAGSVPLAPRRALIECLRVLPELAADLERRRQQQLREMRDAMGA